MSYSVNTIQGWISEARTTFAAKTDELNELDAVIGDGDHGTNMAAAFASAAQMDFSSHDSPAEIFRQIGLTFLGAGTVGGRMFFGTFFLALGANWPSEENTPRVAAAFREARNAVQARTGLDAGDKSMIDALDAAVRAMQALDADVPLQDAWKAAAEAAAEGAQATADMIDKANPQSEAALGTVDAGAQAMAILLDVATRHL